jgi:hypothetical protein
MIQDILVWRQEHPEQKGRFAYKMYGRFDDVTALEFLEVSPIFTSSFLCIQNLRKSLGI